MVNMTQADVRDVKNKLEESFNGKPVYDLALIDSVLWRVGVADTEEIPGRLKSGHERLAIPSNSQGFRGTALSSKGNKIHKEFIRKTDNADQPVKS
jgi:hypothetical protein